MDDLHPNLTAVRSVTFGWCGFSANVCSVQCVQTEPKALLRERRSNDMSHDQGSFRKIVQ